MDASKSTNGSRDEILAKRTAPAPKSVQSSAAPSETKKVDRKSTGKKTKTARPQVKPIRKSKSEKLVCRYCGSDDLAPSFIKRRDRRCRKCFSKRYGSAARTRKTKGQEVGLPKSMIGAGLERSSALAHFCKGGSRHSDRLPP